MNLGLWSSYHIGFSRCDYLFRSTSPFFFTKSDWALCQKIILIQWVTFYYHLYYHINVVFLFHFYSLPSSIPPTAHSLQPSFFPPPIHNHPYHVAAHVGAESFHIRDAKRARHVCQGVVDQVGLGTASLPLPLGTPASFRGGTISVIRSRISSDCRWGGRRLNRPAMALTWRFIKLWKWCCR